MRNIYGFNLYKMQTAAKTKVELLNSNTKWEQIITANKTTIVNKNQFPATMQ